MIPFTQEANFIQLSEELAPLALGILKGNPLPDYPTGIELTPAIEYAGSNPVLVQLFKQKRLLAHLPKNRMLDTLTEVVQQAEGLKIRIILGSEWRDVHVCNFLRAKGIDCFYVAQQALEEQPLPKVLLASEYRFASNSFSIDQGELVVFCEPDTLLNCADIDLQRVFYGPRPYQNIPDDAHRLDARCLFDPDFPTRFNPKAMILALTCEPYSTPDKAKLAGFFPAGMTIGPDGNQTFAGSYRMVPYRHKYVPSVSPSPTRLEVLRGCIWQNQHRNKFIMQIASAVSNEGRRKELLLRQPGLEPVFDGIDIKNVVILVANNLHEVRLFQNYKYHNNGDVSTIRVLTFEELLAQGHSALEGRVVIRGEAGIGGFPIPEMPFEVTLLDIADSKVPVINFCKQARQKAYQQEGWKEITHDRPI